MLNFNAFGFAKNINTLPLLGISLALVSGCVATNPQNPQKITEKNASLSEPVGIKFKDSQGNLNYAYIREVRVKAFEGVNLPPGKIWLLYYKNNNVWRSLYELDSWGPWNWTTNRKVAASIQIKERGEPAFNSIKGNFVWCPQGVNPNADTSKSCNLVLNLLGRVVKLNGQEAIDNKNYQLPLYGVAQNSSDVILEVHNASRAFEEVGRINQNYNASREREVARSNAEKKATAESYQRQERQRLDLLKNMQKGVQIRCTSVDLVPRERPVGDGLIFNCTRIGRTSIGELQQFGWRAQVVSRIPTQGMFFEADSVEMSAEKN